MSYLNTKKHILLTNIWLSNYTGSELNCLNLATVLSDMGYCVEVATFDHQKPLAKDFKESNIPVVNIFESPLSRSHYDIIWGHHAIILDYLIFTQKITADHLIVSALSPFDPFEIPPIYANAASLCLANSEETKEKMISEGVRKDKILVFPNYVDSKWIEFIHSKSYTTTPKKIAIVSNHIPEELIQAIPLLQAHNCSVDVYGMGYTYVKITPEILSKYDLVISIGKTIQYCMALKVPIYCYDVHGGPGFINNENFKTASHFNFSGRGFSKKTALEITNDIMNNYFGQLDFLEQHYDYIQKTSILEKNIESALSIAYAHPVSFERIATKYARAERSNTALVTLFQFRQEALRLREEKQNLEIELRYSENKLRCLQAERDDFSNRLNSIYNSRLWKMRNILRKFIKK